MLRKLCCGLILLCLLFSASAEEPRPDGFLFMDAIDWNCNAQDVLDILGEDAEYAEDFAPEFGTIELVRAYNREVSGYHAEWVIFLFYNGALSEMGACFSADAVPDEGALIEMLSESYGTPHIYGENAISLGSTSKPLCSWTLGENTHVKFSRMEDEPVPYTLYALNKPVSDAMNEALMRLYSAQLP